MHKIQFVEMEGITFSFWFISRRCVSNRGSELVRRAAGESEEDSHSLESDEDSDSHSRESDEDSDSHSVEKRAAEGEDGEAIVMESHDILREHRQKRSM
jgi:hypothetical protein